MVDHFTAFGQDVGTDAYAGSLLEGFQRRDHRSQGIRDIGLARQLLGVERPVAIDQFGAAQVATLDFQTSSLGAGSFHFASDGAGGLLIKHG